MESPLFHGMFGDNLSATSDSPATVGALDGSEPRPDDPAGEHPRDAMRSLMTSAEYTTVGYELDGHVATVTLNRPERHNAFNEQMTLDIQQVWQRVRQDDEVRVVVLRAAGDRAFCTGIDVREGAWWTDVNVRSRAYPGAVLGPKQQGGWKRVVAAR